MSNPTDLIQLCPEAQRHIDEIPPYIGVTGDALRLVVRQCLTAQLESQQARIRTLTEALRLAMKELKYANSNPGSRAEVAAYLHQTLSQE